MTPNIVQGNDFKFVVKLEYKIKNEGVVTNEPYTLIGSSDIHVYLTKLNNAARCIDKFEVGYELDSEEGHENYIIANINESLPTGAYGVEVTGISEYGENWRFRAKEGELFNIVDATSASSYESDEYINFDAEIGVIGINTPSAIFRDYVDEEISKLDDELSERIDALEDTVETNEADIESKVSDLTDDLTTLNELVNTNENDIETKLAAEVSRSTAADQTHTTDIANLTTTVANNKTDIESKLTTESNRAKASEQANTNAIAALAATVSENKTDIEGKLNTEITNRTNADTALQDNIDTLEAKHDQDVQDLQDDIDAIPRELDNEFVTPQGAEKGHYIDEDTQEEVEYELMPTTGDTYQEAIQKLTDNVVRNELVNTNTLYELRNDIADIVTDISNLSGTVNSNNINVSTDLSTEITNRTNADTALQANIDALESKHDQDIQDLRDDLDDRIEAVIGSAPSALDTLGEIADKLGDNDDAVANIITTIGNNKTDIEGKLTTETNRAQVAEQANATAISTLQSIKANSADLATVATSGSYNDLSDKPTIPVVPTNVSAFTNDAGYLTTHQDISGKANSADLATVATTGSYTDLSNKPTNVSAFTNDAGYLTEHQSLDDYYNKTEVDGIVDNISLELDNEFVTPQGAEKGHYIDEDTQEEVEYELMPTTGDTYQEAIQKLTDNVVRNELVNSNALFDLQGNIDNINSSISAINSAINSNNTNISTDLSTEITNRTNADTALQANIDALESKHDQDIQDVLDEIDDRIEAVIGSAPAALDTLGEIATKLGDNDDAVAGLVTTIAANKTDIEGKLTTETNRAQVAEQANATAISTLQSTKANTADLATVATSGSYNDLINIPTTTFSKTYYNIAYKYINIPFVKKLKIDGSATLLMFQLTNNPFNVAYSLYTIYGSVNAYVYTSSWTSNNENVRVTEDPNDSRYHIIEFLNGYCAVNLMPAGGSDSWVYISYESIPETMLYLYAFKEDLAAVATSGSYNDLTNKPTIPEVPTNVSDFVNDAGYITEHQDISGKANSSDLATVATSGSYNDLSNKPTLFSGSYNDLSDKPTISTGNKYSVDISVRDIYKNGNDYYQKFNILIYDNLNDTKVFDLASYLYSNYYYGQLSVFHSGQNDSIKQYLSDNYNIGLYINDADTVWNETENIKSNMFGQYAGTPVIYCNKSGTNWLESHDPQIIVFDKTTKRIYASYSAHYYVYKTSQLVNDSGYLTQHQDISGKANTSDLATVATSGSYNDLSDKPTLFSGDYNDLSNKPTLFSGDYTDLTNKPTLFSGSYNDLTNKPTIPTVPTNVSTFTNDAGYLTSHQSLDNYSTLQHVEDRIGNIGTVQTGVIEEEVEGETVLSPVVRPKTIKEYVDTELGTSETVAAHALNEVRDSVYTKTEVDNKVAGIVTSSTIGLKIEIVTQMPATPDENTIYIVR